MALSFANNRAVYVRALAEAEPDDNIIHGTDGNDTLVATFQTTALYGYGGDDFLISNLNGSRMLFGGAGRDTIYVVRTLYSSNPGSDEAFGGDGNDVFHANVRYGSAILSGEDGDDVFHIYYQQGDLTLSGGAGSDLYILESAFAANSNEGPIVITDFETGINGDNIDLSGVYTYYTFHFGFNDVAGTQDPFTRGLFRLVQVGDDTHIEVNVTPRQSPQWISFVSFSNTQASDIVAENLYGLPPHGGDPVGIALTGDDSDNEIVGGFGGDTIQGLGGDDTLSGKWGDDTLFGGDGNDTLSGGSGADTLNGGNGRDIIYFADGDIVSGGAYSDNFISPVGFGPEPVIIEDFETGIGGDVLTTDPLWSGLRNYPGVNPFASGHFRFVQVGVDTEFQINHDAMGDDWKTVIYLKNTDAGTFTTENLNGLPPDGNNPAGMTFTGDNERNDISGGIGDDIIYGLGGHDTLNGQGGDDQIFGGEGNDKIRGGLGADILHGGTGADTIVGGDGNDQLFGEEDYDELHGYTGDDVLHGGRGNDDLFGGDGSDMLFGDEDNDYLDGGEGDDVIYGGAGNDRLDGRGGDDVLHGGAGNDSMNGQGGADRLYGEFGDDRLYGFPGDQLFGGEGNDRFHLSAGGTSSGMLIASGDAGDDIFYVAMYSGKAFVSGGDGQDSFFIESGGFLSGGAESDRFLLDLYDYKFDNFKPAVITDFETGPGGDVLYVRSVLDYLSNLSDQTLLESGHFRISQSGVHSVFEVDYDGGGDDWTPMIYFANTDATTFSAENFSGAAADGSTTAALTLTGSAGKNLIVGGPWHDTIYGLAGYDELEGGAGDDQIFGGSGIDILDGGTGADVLYGDEGNDVLKSRYGNDRLYGGANDDRFELIRSQESTDIVQASGETGDDTFNVKMYGGRAFASGGAGQDTFRIFSGGFLSGGADSDRFVIEALFVAGGNIAPVITDFETGAGGDVLDPGGFLNDLANSPAANPFESGHYRLIQNGAHTEFQVNKDGLGDDWLPVIFFTNTDASSFTAENFEGPDPMTGMNAMAEAEMTNEPLTGDDDPNTIEGTEGDDIIYGLGGDDILIGNGGDDLIQGGAGNDYLTGGAGTDMLHGEFGDDELVSSYSGSGNDSLYGGWGNDTISVSRRADSTDILQASGGPGADRFYVSMEGGKAFLSGGDGTDYFDIRSGGFLSGGADVDTYFVNAVYFQFYGNASQRDKPAVILDFETGAGGDTVNTASLQSQLTKAPQENPFNTGHFRLVQQGANAVFQVNLDGGGDDWAPVIYFADRDVGDFTAENFGGLPPDGSKPAGQMITGGPGQDYLAGGWGDDIIHGLALRDQLHGRGGDDILYGGDGNDYLDGGFGADILHGEFGDDELVSYYSGLGNDRLYGGWGNDTIRVSRGADSTDILQASGGPGADRFHVSMEGGKAFLSGGDGTDYFDIRSGGFLSGDAGVDTYRIDAIYFRFYGDPSQRDIPVVIVDFETGAGGDIVDTESLQSRLTNGPLGNPFNTGHFRLVQQGDHTVFEVDRDGGGDVWVPVMYFSDRDVGDFTAENFNGLDPLGNASSAAPVAIDDALSMPSDELVAEVPESSPFGLGYVEETDLLMW